MLRNNNLLLGGAAQRSFTRVFTDSGSNTGGATSFTGRQFGEPSPERLIIICVDYTTASLATLSSATIGGVAATIIKQTLATSNGIGSAIIAAALPTGKTGDVDFTFSSSIGGIVVAIYALYGRLTAGVAANDSASANSGTTLSGTIAVPAHGVVFGCCFANKVGTATWTNLTEDVAPSSTSSFASGQFATANPALTISVSRSGSPTGTSFVCASWGP